MAWKGPWKTGWKGNAKGMEAVTGRNVNCLTVKTETHSRKRISCQHARNACQMLRLVAIKYARRSDKSSLSQNKAFILKQETFNR